MKKTFAFLAASCLLLLCACQGNPQAGIPTAPLAAAGELLRSMTPEQGGEMLYPAYYRAQSREWWFEVETPQDYAQSPGFFPMLGLIKQNGERVAPAQFESVVYYKDANGRIQYLFASTPDGRCIVYSLDGSVYDEIPARRVVDFLPGVPYIIMSIDGSAGAFAGQYESVYGIAEKKLLFENTSSTIQFLDRHTLHLSWTEAVDEETMYTEESMREALYDLDAGRLIPMQGFLKMQLSNDKTERITHLPAIQTFSWQADKPEGYVSREGVWTETLPQDAVLPRAMAQDEEYRDFFARKEDVVGGHYKWQESLDYQGYVDEAGEWVWREARQYAFLED